MQRATARNLRLQIGLFGRRNVGKSSLLNAITRQNVSIVSEIAGTTTDPVEKPMELQPFGPVVFVDTAGVDDVGALGAQRIAKTRQIIARVDLGIVVSEADAWGEFEDQLVAELQERDLPILVAVNKTDLGACRPDRRAAFAQQKIPFVEVAAKTGFGIDELRHRLRELAPASALETPAVVRDLVAPGQTAVFVTPIDREAPKGRIKQLQVQCLRDLLDGDAHCIVTKETGLEDVLAGLKTPPALVVTDAQVFGPVARITPPDVPLTAFSILLARWKGDLIAQVEGVAAVNALEPGDRVLIAESCTHHPVEDDIGRVKIPRWLEQHVGGALDFTTVQGHDFPADLASYKLVIHCGACMTTRAEMQDRIRACRRQRVPITNYGLIIAQMLGILPRAIEPFPQAVAAYERALDAHAALPQVPHLPHFVEHGAVLV